jgi:succinate dehydrogenase/fumarate reductase flavoprotein subunit
MTPVTHAADIAIIGGGTGGCAAALAALEAGAGGRRHGTPE